MENFVEIKNWGMNLSTLVFIVTIFFTLLQAVALIKQNNKIVKNRSGESVSFIFFSYYGFSALAVIAYGLFNHSLALTVNGFLGFLVLVIIFNLLRFRKNSVTEKVIGLGSALAIPLIIFLPQKDVLFLIFGSIVMMTISLQIIEIWKNKSSGSVHLAQTIVSLFSGSVWLIYAIMTGIWPLQVMNSIGLILWMGVLLSYLKFKNNPRKIKHQFLLEVLKNCYPEKEIYSTDLDIIDNSKVTITFFFPQYKRTKREISYVSGTQIIPALYEGMFVSAGNYVKNETDKIMDFNYSDFPENMWSVIFREFDKLVFSKKIEAETFVKFNFEIASVEKIKNFYIFNFQFSGPVRGGAKCVIPV
jgi:uncharacterized protein with PQ loop repeat